MESLQGLFIKDNNTQKAILIILAPTLVFHE